MLDGMKVKKYVASEEEKHILVIKENVKYNIKDIKNKYLPNFENLIEEEILEPCSFEDNVWKGSDEFGSMMYSLRFGFEVNKEINTILKCYAILKLSEQYTSINNVYRAVSAVSKFLLLSNVFNESYIENIRDGLLSWNDTQKCDMGYVKEFIKFSGIHVPNSYKEFIASIKYVPSSTRLLPSYKSILTFDYLIKSYFDVMDSTTINPTLEYMPIILWWELTKIIPMRPIEFSILKRDALCIENNEYFINIERRKEKGGKVKYKTINVLTKLKIPEELYLKIEQYIAITNPLAKNNFIFSYEVYKYFTKTRDASAPLDYLGTYGLRKLLNNFFKKVIHKEYGYTVFPKDAIDRELNDYEIEKIQLGDTRHIAFCNLMLQGFNPLTIAEIGGHYTLSQQTSYCGHLDSFVDAHTFVLTKSLRNKMVNNASKNLALVQNVKKSQLVLREQLGDSFYTLPKISGGRCKSKNFPYECKVDDHIFCEHFILDETFAMQSLDTYLNHINMELKNKVDYIKSLTNTLFGISKTPTIEADLKTNTKNLNTLIKQKAIIESYKLDIQEKEVLNYE